MTVPGIKSNCAEYFSAAYPYYFNLTVFQGLLIPYVMYFLHLPGLAEHYKIANKTIFEDKILVAGGAGSLVT